MLITCNKFRRIRIHFVLIVNIHCRCNGWFRMGADMKWETEKMLRFKTNYQSSCNVKSSIVSNWLKFKQTHMATVTLREQKLLEWKTGSVRDNLNIVLYKGKHRWRGKSWIDTLLKLFICISLQIYCYPIVFLQRLHVSESNDAYFW